MWIPKLVYDTLSASAQSSQELKEELAATKAERDSLKLQLATINTSLDWIRTQFNMLSYERTALLEKAFEIKLPAPEIVRTQSIPKTDDILDFSFDDIGDKVAKKLGLPLHDV